MSTKDTFYKRRNVAAVFFMAGFALYVTLSVWNSDWIGYWQYPLLLGIFGIGLILPPVPNSTSHIVIFTGVVIGGGVAMTALDIHNLLFRIWNCTTELVLPDARVLDMQHWFVWTMIFGMVMVGVRGLGHLAEPTDHNLDTMEIEAD